MPRPRPVVCRGHRGHLRLVTTMIGTVCGSVAVVVFVITPRTGQNRLPPQFMRPILPAQSGFIDEVNLSSAPLGEGGKEPVLNFSVRVGQFNKGDVNKPWLLRGAALDQYDFRSHTWTRSRQASEADRSIMIDQQGVVFAVVPRRVPVFSGRITLRQSGYRALFAPASVTQIGSENLTRVVFNPLDQQLAADEVVRGAVIYSLEWPLRTPNDLDELYMHQFAALKSKRRPSLLSAVARRAPDEQQYARNWKEPDRLAAFALDTIRKHGLGRDPEVGFDPQDSRIASVLAGHLRENYEYVLRNPPVGADNDPVSEFLFNHRRGHCELFASALVALTRSIGMQARVITGFRASEYNSIGGYYVVRQSNVHAWTEVNCGPGVGWLTFDATPPESVRAEHHVRRTWLTIVRELYEYLEFAWIGTVVTYDDRARASLLLGVNRSIGAVTPDRGSAEGALRRLWGTLREVWRLDPANYSLACVAILTLGVALASLGRIFIVRRRRLTSLQLTALPPSMRRGLAHKLGFYLSMLDMLERRGHVRPPWQSPFSFASQLAQSHPGGAFSPVVALTEVFYEIRFGHRDMDPDRKAQIRGRLKALDRALGGR